MKRFILNQILKPAAATGFAIACSGAVVFGFASLDKLQDPAQDLTQITSYSEDIAWSGVFSWLGATAIAQLFGGFQEEEEESDTDFKERIDTATEGILEILMEDLEEPQAEPFDYGCEIDKHHDRLTKEKCATCRFYCGDNPYLNCAVHPELKYICPDFRPR